MAKAAKPETIGPFDVYTEVTTPEATIGLLPGEVITVTEPEAVEEAEEEPKAKK